MKLNRNLCVVNIGPSRFFLHQTAQSLARDSFDVQTISGLVANSRNPISRAARRFFRSGTRLIQRVDGVNDQITRYESLSGEFFWQIGTFLGRYKLMSSISNFFYSLSLTCFDLLGIWVLRKYEKGLSGIYYVRSGCGNRSIPYAANLGFKIVVDHSTTHPLYDLSGTRMSRTENYSRFSVEARMIADLNQNDNIIVNSQFVLDTFRIVGDKRELKVLLPPIDSRFSQILRQTNSKFREGLVYFGLASARKGIRELAEVLAFLPKSLPVNIIGNWKPEMYAIRSSLSKMVNVKLEPHCDYEQLVQRLSSARYFLFIAQGEGSARTVGEALHSGLIVLTTKHAGMPFQKESILDITGLSALEIAELILELEENEQLRENISKNARMYIQQLEKDYELSLVEYLRTL